MAEGNATYLSVTWPILTDTPITIDTLFPSASSPGGRLVSPSLSSSAHFSPTVLPKCLSAFTPAASYTLRGWDLSSACHTRTPILQKKKQGPQGWWGETEAGGDEGRQGLWWGAFVRVPAEGRVSDWTRQPTGHRLRLRSAHRWAHVAAHQQSLQGGSLEGWGGLWVTPLRF